MYFITLYVCVILNKLSTVRLLLYQDVLFIKGFLGGTNGKERTCQCRRHRTCGFDPCVGKIPWRRAWQPTSVFLPGESHGRGVWWATVHRVTKSRANVLVSDVQYNDPAIHINTYLFFFRFFSLIGYYRILSIFPVLYSRSLLVIYLIYSNVCMLKYNS